MGQRLEPLVSVYMPTHNRRNYLSRAINSVLAQDYNNFEVVIVDDGSSDGTWNFLLKMRDKHERLRCFRLASSQGACKARNIGIKHCSGELIMSLDDDDYLLPDRISALMKKYSKQFSLVGGSFQEDNGSSIIQRKISRKLVSYEDIKKKNYIGNQCIVAKDRVLKVGGYDESLKAWQDYDLWLRLIDRFGPAVLIGNQSCIVNTRTDRYRITNSTGSQVGYLQFMKKHSDRFSDEEKLIQSLNDKSNRNERIGFWESVSCVRNRSAFKLMLTLHLRTRLGYVHSKLLSAHIWLSKWRSSPT